MDFDALDRVVFSLDKIFADDGQGGNCKLVFTITNNLDSASHDYDAVFTFNKELLRSFASMYYNFDEGWMSIQGAAEFQKLMPRAGKFPMVAVMIVEAVFVSTAVIVYILKTIKKKVEDAK